MKNITNIPGADKDIEIVDYIETPGVSEEDELLQAPASNLGWAITFKDPASFVDQMAADDFTYELPDSRKFCGKHVLDKELYREFDYINNTKKQEQITSFQREFGKKMIDFLKKKGSFSQLKQALQVGNFRLHYYKSHQMFFDQ